MPRATLSQRERQIAESIAAGLRRNEIADALGLKRQTVDAHLRLAYLKLGAHNVAQMIRALREEADGNSQGS